MAASDDVSRCCGCIPWELATILTCFFIWAGCYATRDHLLVTQESFKASENVSDAEWGRMMSFGYASYLTGKIIFGLAADRFSGKVCLSITVIGSSVVSFALSFGGNPTYFAIMWTLLRFTQSAGWLGIVNIVGEWMHFEKHGRTMAFLSLSFLVGDASIRSLLGLVVSGGFSWRAVVRLAAAAQAALILPLCAFVHSSPTKVGLEKPPANPNSVYAAASSEANQHPRASASAASPPVWEIIKPLLKSVHFWLNCALSFQLSGIRETLNVFSVNFLEHAGQEESSAAATSALFPLFGIPSVILLGWAVDKFERKGWRKARVGLFCAFICILIPCLLAMSRLGESDATPRVASALLAIAGLSLLGPYSLLAGVFSLDIGGEQGKSTACGLTDAFGYAGAFASMVVSSLGVSFQTYFFAMFLVACSALAAGIWLSAIQNKSRAPTAIKYEKLELEMA